jgi:hypothetical protein
MSGSRSTEVHAPRATARLPGLNIEVVHRQSPARDAEEISIHLQAVSSFEAFGRLAWRPWVEATRVAMLPFGSAAALPKAGADAPRLREPHAG